MLIKDLCKLIAGKKVALRDVAILLKLERALGPIEALGKRAGAGAEPGIQKAHIVGETWESLTDLINVL